MKKRNRKKMTLTILSTNRLYYDMETQRQMVLLRVRNAFSSLIITLRSLQACKMFRKSRR